MNWQEVANLNWGDVERTLVSGFGPGSQTKGNKLIK